MNGTQSRQPVIAAVCPGEESKAALEYAVRVAVSRGCPLQVVHVWHPQHGGPETVLLTFTEPSTIATETLAGSVEHATDACAGDVPVGGRLLRGPTSRALVEASHGAGLVVMGHRSRSLAAHALSPSLCGRVAGRSHAPVLAVPAGWVAPGPGDKPKPVTVGVDVPSRSRPLLREAFRAADELGADLRVLHVWRPPRLAEEAALGGLAGDPWMPSTDRGLVDELDAVVRDVAADFPDVVWTTEAVPAVVTAALQSAASGSSLMVVGRHDALLPVGSRLGSVAAYVLRKATCPVLIVPPRPEPFATAPAGSRQRRVGG
ncbi:universal stress protein [Nocardioides sp. KR10-350]|uniref:universal stress protein n=1 Tax=Nocardioides cheoyonin TaxID=3156615 RepID=UPI0032B376FB